MGLAGRFAALASGVLLVAALVVTAAAPIVRGDDSICATKPDQCVTLTMNVSGYIDGHGFDQFMPAFDCDHVEGRFTDSCHWAYGVLSTKVITITAQANNPAGVTVCIGTQCGPSPQSRDFTLTAGQRGPSANITINPTNGTAVSISKSGTGTGTVTSNPGNIVCGSACSWTYFPNTAVTLVAAASGDSVWAGWGAGPCSGQDVTCHFTTGSSTASTTIIASFSSPTPAPTSTPHATSTPHPTSTPAHSSPPKTPTPSAGHSSAPTTRPPTQPPGSAPPGGVTPDPNATPIPATSDVPTTDPNPGPTPTPFTFASDDPNRTEPPLDVVPSQQPAQPAADTGSGPPVVAIGLVLLLGVLVGGGVFWWARRRNSAT